MAFLCSAKLCRPRRKRTKSTIGGRITGSASIDTLVNIGLVGPDETFRNNRCVVVLHDFVPCVEDELKVARGEQVIVMYREHDWVYVVADDGREGFVPFAYCCPLNVRRRSMDNMHLGIDGPAAESQGRDSPTSVSRQFELSQRQSRSKQNSVHSNNNNKQQDITATQTVQTHSVGGLNRAASSSMPDITNIPVITDATSKPQMTVSHQRYASFQGNSPIKPSANRSTVCESPASMQSSLFSDNTVQLFVKRSHGRFIVLFNFQAREENDITVRRGDFVTVLNKDDQDWYWILKSDNSEGFVPSNYLCPAQGQQSFTGKTSSEKIRGAYTQTVHMEAQGNNSHHYYPYGGAQQQHRDPYISP